MKVKRPRTLVKKKKVAGVNLRQWSKNGSDNLPEYYQALRVPKWYLLRYMCYNFSSCLSNKVM